MQILKNVQSLCPKCGKPVKATYTERDGKVFFEKTCPNCGNFSTLAADNIEDYIAWADHPVINIPPKTPLTKGSALDECPLHCGTCENHLQTACCIVLNITKRCNQHCPYCFARADEDDFSEKEPSLSELSAKYDRLLELGEERPFNIQLSGGEPTVRDDLPKIIEMAKNKGFEYIQINSNGKRLALEDGYALKLKRAGASVIFMQFDGTREDIYLALRGEALLEIKKKAIANCKKAGLPVTIVPTIVKDVNLDNIGEMMEFLLNNIAVVKGIHFQPVSYFGRYPQEPADDGFKPHDESEAKPISVCPDRVTMFDVMHELENQTSHFKYSDFCPINTGHPLCCFYSTYLKEGPQKVKCLVSSKTKAQGVSCCDTTSCGCSDASTAYDDVSALEIVKKDRDFVLNKWDLPEESAEDNEPCCCCDPEAGSLSFLADPQDEPQNDAICEKEQKEPVDLDEFLHYYKSNTFTVTGMAFQDMSNLDAERLKRCRVQVMTEDDRLVPFCGYVSLDR